MSSSETPHGDPSSHFHSDGKQFIIVTPTRNSGATLDQTIRSVLSQNFSGKIHYHIQDCLSEDNTVDIAEAWIGKLRADGNPLGPAEVSMTLSSERDNGMYDAISKAFIRVTHEVDDPWLTWINSDDILCAYSTGLVSLIQDFLPDARWIGGCVAVMSNYIPTSTHRIRHSAELIRHGLADGDIYPFVQQEGTFFRSSLYQECGSSSSFGGMRFAGDWNLWRKFAHHTEIYQVDFPLGYFCVTEGQLSSRLRQEYENEINAQISRRARQEVARQLLGSSLEFRHIQFEWKSGIPKLSTNHSVPDLNLGDMEISHPEESELKPEPSPSKSCSQSVIPGVEKGLVIRGNVVLLNQRWQYPAATEMKAAEFAWKLLSGLKHVSYLGFPWATLIDLLNSQSANAKELLHEFQKLTIEVKNRSARVLTVCQHIHAERYIKLFEQAGVTDIFWSHAHYQSSAFVASDRLRVHPFPLLAVNYSSHPKPLQDRRYHVNFIGAKGDGWYITDSRSLILEQYQSQDRWLVSANDEWFFSTVVYKIQIEGDTSPANNAVWDEKRRKYIEILSDSVFTLCPSGSGPNTIRLWEAIGSGSIPIVLSDAWKPPGDLRLWRRSCVFLPDTPQGVAMIKERVEVLLAQPEQLRERQMLLRQLWCEYGPETFVTDLCNMSGWYEQAFCSLYARRKLVR